MIRAKNTYYDPQKPKTSVFYPMSFEVTDKTGKKYVLFHRGKAQFHVDIPIGKNDIGLIVKGYFFLLFSGHPYAVETVEKIARAKKWTKNENIEKSAQKMLINFQKERGKNDK